MSVSLRPQFFCTRPNGTLTPLIAVDELPAHISICGIPRALSPNETQGMTSLGTVSPRAQSYVVEGVTPTTTRAASTNAANNRSRSYDLQSSLVRLLADENIPANQRLALHNLLQQGGLPQNWHAGNPNAASWLVPNTGAGAANGNGNPRQKEYCSYWIRHGECDYQQQGCLYKHEMPHDPSMLEKLGLRDIPRWYREKYGFASLLPNGGASIKSIQYPPRLGINASGESSDFEKNAQQKVTAPISTHEQVPAVCRMPLQGASSSTGPVSQKQGPKNPPSDLNSGAQKIDLLSFDQLQSYPSRSGLVYHSPTENSFEASEKAHREDLVRNLQSLVPSPIHPNADYLTSPFDPVVGPSRSRKIQKSRRLYQPRSQDVGPDNIAVDMAGSDTLRSFQNLTLASSSGASVASKTTGSQLASPVADHLHGSTASEPPTRGASPSIHSGTSQSSGASPSVIRTRSKDKTLRRTPGAIGTKRLYRKRSVGSSEDDLFGFTMEHGKK